MPTIPRRTHFFETEAGREIEQQLRLMMADTAFNTEGTYTPDGANYPDNVMPFVDKHKRYLIANPAVDPTMYLANVRLKNRLRR